MTQSPEWLCSQEIRTLQDAMSSAKADRQAEAPAPLAVVLTETPEIQVAKRIEQVSIEKRNPIHPIRWINRIS